MTAGPASQQIVNVGAGHPHLRDDDMNRIVLSLILLISATDTTRADSAQSLVAEGLRSRVWRCRTESCFHPTLRVSTSLTRAGISVTPIRSFTRCRPAFSATKSLQLGRSAGSYFRSIPVATGWPSMCRGISTRLIPARCMLRRRRPRTAADRCARGPGQCLLWRRGLQDVVHHGTHVALQRADERCRG